MEVKRLGENEEYVKFGSLAIGKVFEYENKLFLKCQFGESDCTIRGVVLRSGMSMTFVYIVPVKIIKGCFQEGEF